MNKVMLIYFVCAIALTFIITVLVSRKLIPVLKSHKMGQKILEVGPRWHKNKEGTPTMGGLAFIIASTVTAAAVIAAALIRGELTAAAPLVITYIMALLNGMIGLLDDYVKLFKKRNEGLSAKQKYLLQLIVSGGYLFSMYLCGAINTELYIPYFKVTLDFGVFYWLIALIALTGIINAVNLTDGIDGLASSVTFVVGAFFAIEAFMLSSFETSIIAALIIGSCLGFLVYNFYPARVFMGDTGSLFLGGLVIGSAFLIGNPLIIVVAGLVYLCEAVSVTLQVIYFKLTHGKRLFKMAPIHHHFEKCGWSELKIVSVFSLVTLAMCAIAMLG